MCVNVYILIRPFLSPREILAQREEGIAPLPRW